ncbi:hypothetical protein AB4156_15950 [Cupriavidus sp. 2MCAB6]|uniref:hypothetical protein n=1 Tax=Cupriavidus sp. 2MCAB6 TaxID=3232981 RepID=UPI003F8E5C90
MMTSERQLRSDAQADVDDVASWSLVWGERPPRLHVLSDVHLETGPYQIPHGLEFDILVAAGDIGPVELAVPWLAGLGVPIVYVLGNHEAWDRDIGSIVEAARNLARGTDVHVLEQESVVIGGVRFLGATLWTDFGEWHPALVQSAATHMQDYRYISATEWYQQSGNADAVRGLLTSAELPGLEPKGSTEGTIAFSPAIAYCIHKKTVAWLEDELSESFSGPTIVVTHHAPSRRCLSSFGVDEGVLNPSNWSDMRHHPDFVRVGAYASALEPLLAEHRTKIAAWVHGHLHMHADLLVEGVRVTSNARGYALGVITERDITEARWLGLRLTRKDVEQSELRYRNNPFLGDGKDFDPSFVLDLSTGFHAPLTSALEEVVAEVEAIISDCKKLLPYINIELDVPRYAVRRAFADNIHRAEIVLDKVASGPALALDKHAGKTLSIIETPPHLPALASFNNGHVEPSAEKMYARVLANLESWRLWLMDIPSAASVAQKRWCQVALSALTWCQGRGTVADLLRPKWRGAFELAECQHITLVTDEPDESDMYLALDKYLVDSGYRGFVPMIEARDALNAADRNRLLTGSDLRAICGDI